MELSKKLINKIFENKYLKYEEVKVMDVDLELNKIKIKDMLFVVLVVWITFEQFKKTYELKKGVQNG